MSDRDSLNNGGQAGVDLLTNVWTAASNCPEYQTDKVMWWTGLLSALVGAMTRDLGAEALPVVQTLHECVRVLTNQDNTRKRH